MNREKALERAIELKEGSEKFESVSFLDSDKEFFEYVVKELERTAQEVPVQEQLILNINGFKTKEITSEVVQKFLNQPDNILLYGRRI
ncbi:MAG: hypothetical protein MR510_08685 [Clostridium sp.]|uniref:hypothetical protein n=1 Tax=Clostridium sp. TaxID=1506 RepID=UPI002A82BF89|nr:hypothetical protein [Clostridium sp.]MCI6692538.1 hypothetical protein [Clostridium sp.]MDY4252571.1 hypothetical protein [Clostridium sp.]